MNRFDNAADFFKAVIHESQTGVVDKRLGPRISDGSIPFTLAEGEDPEDYELAAVEGGAIVVRRKEED